MEIVEGGINYVQGIGVVKNILLQAVAAGFGAVYYLGTVVYNVLTRNGKTACTKQHKQHGIKRHSPVQSVLHGSKLRKRAGLIALPPRLGLNRFKKGTFKGFRCCIRHNSKGLQGFACGFAPPAAVNRLLPKRVRRSRQAYGLCIASPTHQIPARRIKNTPLWAGNTTEPRPRPAAFPGFAA